MDRDAEFTAYVRARSPALLRTAYLLAGNQADAEDLLQTSLAKIYLSWGRIHDRGALDAYARTVLTRTHFSRWRRAFVTRERSTADLTERADLPEQRSDVEAIDDRDVVWRALADIGPRQRAVIVLRYYEGLTEREIAEILGCTVGTVKSQLHRGLARLAGTPARCRGRGKPAAPDHRDHPDPENDVDGDREMNQRLDDLLGSTLTERADGVRVPDSFPGDVLAAGRNRRHRRTAEVVTGIAALAVAGVAIGTSGVMRDRPDTLAAPTSSGSETAGHTDWYDALPAGAPVAVTPRLEIDASGRTHLVTATARVALADDSRTQFSILGPSPKGTLLLRIRPTTAPTPFDSAVLDVDGAGRVTTVTDSAVVQGKITGAAADPRRSGDYAISTEVDPNGIGDGPDFLKVLRAGQAPRVRQSPHTGNVEVRGWTTRGVLVATSDGMRLWDPASRTLALVDAPEDRWAQVVPGHPDRVLVHRPRASESPEVTGWGGSCLWTIDVTTRAERKIMCGDDSPSVVDRKPMANAVSPDGSVVLAGGRAWALDGSWEGPPLTSAGGFVQTRFENASVILYTTAGDYPDFGKWWVRCEVRTARCERAPLPDGIRGIALR